MRFLTSFKEFLIEFLIFIRKPNQNFNKINWSLNSLFIIILFTFLLYFLVVIGSYFIDLIPINLPKRNDGALMSRLQTIPTFITLLIGGIIVPVLEEIAFRLPLRLSLKNISISFISSAIIELFLNRQSFSKLYLDHNVDIEIIRVISLFGFTLFVLIYFYISKFTTNKFYWIYFYAIAFLFTVLHNVSYIHSFTDILISFALWFHIFLLALWTGFLRLKFGLSAAILSHIQYNATVIIVSTLIYYYQ